MVCGKEVFVLTSHAILPLRSSLSLTQTQQRDDELYRAMLDGLLATRSLYFSYQLDLTHSLQRQSQMLSSGRNVLPMWQRADSRFFWNKWLQNPLIQVTIGDPLHSNLSRFILPMICGFVTTHSVNIHSASVVFSLVSRRSVHRAGTRYHCRGIDDKGAVANFVETEQIVEHGGHSLAYIQTRGSIPLFWRQVINVKYQPKLVIEERSATSTALRTHFSEQIALYGDQVVVNLINKHGYESPLGDAFAKHVAMLDASIASKLRYIHFDFHNECKKMRWDRISVLVDQIKPELEAQGYFHSESTSVKQTQTSIVRTNCMDCLDRTNVVQSVLARYSLTKQLRKIGVLLPQEEIASNIDFEHMFKNSWADNADEISKQYSGTGALKTDFTRTGKRSKSGVAQDLLNSIMRYVKNNFMDGARQDSFDLFLGKYVVSASALQSPFASKSDISTRQILLIFGLIVSLFIGVYAIAFTHTVWSSLYYLVLSLVMTAVVVRLVFHYGTEFVSYPVLVPDLWVAANGDKHYLSKTFDGKNEIQMSEIQGDK